VVALEGGIKTVTVSGGEMGGRLVANGAAGIGTITVAKGGFSGTMSATAANGAGVKSVTVGGGNLVGQILSAGTGGIGTITVSKGGLSGTISAGHANSGIKSLTIAGAVTAGTTISAGTGGVGTVAVKGDADLTLWTTGKVKSFTQTGTSFGPRRTLRGLFDVSVLSSLKQTNADVNGLVVRATGTAGIGTVNVGAMRNTLLSAALIGNVTIAGDLEGSKLLAGYDIGEDLDFDPQYPGHDGEFTGVKGSIGAVNVKGSMSSTSIAAGIACGADRMFGDSNDVVLAGTLEGAIKSLTVKGTLSGLDGSTESFGVVAHGKIGSGFVTVGGVKHFVTLPDWVNGTIRVTQNWR